MRMTITSRSETHIHIQSFIDLLVPQCDVK